MGFIQCEQRQFAKKVSIDQLAEFTELVIGQVSPWNLVYTPLYILLKKNQKLLAVKLPLEFFTEEDLKKYLQCENFYLPKETELLSKLNSISSQILNILNSKQTIKLGGETFQVDAHSSEVAAVIRSILQELIESEIEFDGFNSIYLVEQILGPFTGIQLKKLFEESIYTGQQKTALASIQVIQSMIYGYCNYDYLIKIRDKGLEQKFRKNAIEVDFTKIKNDLQNKLKKWGGRS